MGWVTVSTKVRRDVVEKARKYGINISQVLRKALEEEVEKRELEELSELAVRVAEGLRKASAELGEDYAARSVREDREGR
ncbi:type II toxin-antitoxin system CcdA family antitoxin [Pyrobaculum sp. 3827-6]|nr:type II toxin-antitoxin system CcdA family antitoxin [Pyrobaculum sp. 3827-6]MCU7787735.1 type II toxin-antitoxin system CcdA family antitoxin [Pyrobaculum sp. 3827-6]